MNASLKPIFFNETLRRWRFKDIVSASGMSRERVNNSLRKLLRERFIRRVKERSRMPYYLANRDSGKFRTEKRLYGLLLLEQSGLLESISSIEGIKTAIVFGSFSRGDWNKESDLDIFVYGDDTKLDKAMFEHKLKHDIHLLSFRDAKEAKRQLDAKLIPNIAAGFSIKQGIEPFEVKING